MLPRHLSPRFAWRLLSRWTGPNLAEFHAARQPTVWLLALLAGLGTAVAAILFRLGIGLVQLPWLGTTAERVASASQAVPWWAILVAPTLGGLIVGVMVDRLLPTRRTGAVADAIEARVNAGRTLAFWPGIWSAIITVVSLGSGASAGREGPIVHLGATIGTALCGRFHLPAAARRTLLACGAAGAISASFNAPIAGVLFAHEVILGHYAMSAFVPIVIASVSGAIVSQLWFGDIAAFTIPGYRITSYLEFPAFALLGIVCAAAAVLFQFALMGTDWMLRNVTIPLWLRPAMGGFAVGALGIAYPEILGVGYEATDLALHNALALQTLLLLLVLKTVATAITLASRFGGGIVSPALFVGAMTGGAFGVIAAGPFPELASSQGLYAILGMGAVAAAVLGAPISTTVMVFELTGGYTLALALLLTVSIASGLSLAVHGRSYFHWQLEMRGHMLQGGPHRHLARSVRVRDFMEAAEPEPPPPADVPRLAPDDRLERALKLFDATGASHIAVVADGAQGPRLVGHAAQVRALRYFNAALVEASREEHG
jgi:chloride channel protein, CIC family